MIKIINFAPHELTDSLIIWDLLKVFLNAKRSEKQIQLFQDVIFYLIIRDKIRMQTEHNMTPNR